MPSPKHYKSRGATQTFSEWTGRQAWWEVLDQKERQTKAHSWPSGAGLFTNSERMLANVAVSPEAVSSSDEGHLILSLVSFVDSGQGLGKTQAVVSLVNLALDFLMILGNLPLVNTQVSHARHVAGDPKAAVDRGQL